MKTNILALAVQGALIAMFTLPMLAQAEEAVVDETVALTHPTNSVQLGVESVSDKSAKFGEYNGLDKNGAYGIANINLRGGNAYEQGDGTTRWQIKGIDLGTTSREIGANISNQGQWYLNIGYDELRHEITDSYQTPQQGSMGGNTFTLPTNFGTYNQSKSNLNSQLPRTLSAEALGDFHTEKVGTSRKNSFFGAGYTFSPQWSVQFDYNHLEQSGAKLIGSSSQGGQTNGIKADFINGTWKAEGMNILMNPTNYTTDTINLAVNWAGEKGHLTGGYYGSLFRDGYNSLNWDNPFVTGFSTGITASNTCTSPGPCNYQANSMSTAPDNQFHQLNLTGGYEFTPSTKLAGGLSYGRNTQNDAYAPTAGYGMMQAAGLPQTSLDGLVINTHADLKLSNQTSKDLKLSAGFKYNERDNRSTSNIYNYIILGVGNYTGVNTPYSNKKEQYELAADYRLTKTQNIRVAYERENIDRWCNHLSSTGAQCIASPSSGEDKLNLSYRLKALENLNFNAAYSYANRDATFDHTFRSPIHSSTIDQLGGKNAVDILGFEAFPYASRTQNALKAAVNWQPTDKLDLSLNSRYAHDDYDATIGVQTGRSVGANLDATYNFNENNSVSAYASWQQSETDMNHGNNGSITLAPTQVWTNQLNNNSNAIGLNTKNTGLIGGKAEILGYLSYSLDKSYYATQVPYTLSPACSATTVLTCGNTPDISTQIITLKVTGNYQVDKHGKVGLAYIYQHLMSNDYVYNAEQYLNTIATLMPTNQQVPNYTVNQVVATYTYNF